MGTRFTTQRSPHGLSELLERLLIEPAVWAGIAVAAGTAWLRWPLVLVGCAALLASGLVGVLRLVAL
ncbi:MAG TPA: hypothetical protein VMV09_09520, partial [Candidatus Saccharimonadales bacterium]|nr:hypothetical protein [Candidatus Saccharimonadales bacterium]